MSTEHKHPKKKKARKFHPIRYIKEMWGEVKKLSWLALPDLAKYAIAVIVFVLVMSTMVYALDFAFGSGVKGINELTGGTTVVADQEDDRDDDDDEEVPEATEDPQADQNNE